MAPSSRPRSPPPLMLPVGGAAIPRRSLRSRSLLSFLTHFCVFRAGFPDSTVPVCYLSPFSLAIDLRSHGRMIMKNNSFCAVE